MMMPVATAEANFNAVGCNAKVSLYEQKDTSLYLWHQIYGLFSYSIFLIASPRLLSQTPEAPLEMVS